VERQDLGVVALRGADPAAGGVRAPAEFGGGERERRTRADGLGVPA
jgi:hypothetical protein